MRRRCRSPRRWGRQHERATHSLDLPPRGQGGRLRSCRAMRAPDASDTAAGEVLLSVERVSLSFGGVVAIRDVSFDIKKGEVRALIGPHGAGKTSRLNVINGDRKSTRLNSSHTV